MFKPVDPRVDVLEVEEEQLKFWRKNDVFERTMTEREGCEKFVFYEGPPTANKSPGSHHVLARAFKDMFPRYKVMTGHYVLRKGGWDTHGLPVEIAVEQELGFEHKHQIEEYGVAPFNEKCRKSVFRRIAEWEKITERIAFWVSLEDAYVTFTNDYIQSVWWILRQLWDKGLLYEGFKVVPYCPRCGTPLSSHEVSLGYEEVSDPSVFVRFPLVDEPDTYLLVWTTTPWTLPGNAAVALAADEVYVKVEGPAPNGEGGTEKLIVAEKLMDDVLLDDVEYLVLEKMKGSDLVGKHYKPLYTFLPVTQDYAYVVATDYVSMDEGTGLVHTAPAYGADDMETGREHDLPVIHTVAADGTFRQEVTPWRGMWVKDADPQIRHDLKERGLLYKDELYTHNYPFCWRCDTPLLYYARGTWFIETTRYRDDMVRLNQQINWVPDHIKDGRFGNWLAENKDWALGRERYWGTPLPVWVCDAEGCGHMHCVGSVAELETLTGDDLSDLDLHRPYVDEISWPCPECGDGTMQRVPELIDVWFDSGAMQVAQWGFPFKNRELFEEQHPADFICEAVDQTRGWFYSLHAIGTMLFDSVAYENVICLGLILDGEGKKMSGSRGNVVEPWDVLNKYGADAFRWYMYTASPPGETRRFSVELVGEVIRSFWLTLWNTYSFFVTYANLDDFDPNAEPVPTSERDLLDRWVLSELYALTRDVTEAYETYDVPGATRPIEAFVERLSNWYVRRSRRRFWKSEDDSDKRAAYQTLYECLVTVAKLLAPAMPFLSEALYRNLAAGQVEGAPDSVHLAEWPEYDAALIEEELMAEMALVQKLVSMGHAARNSEGLKVRQPLASASFNVPANEIGVVGRFEDVIADELNVKAVGVLEDAGDVVKYALNPIPKLLGPKLAGDFPRVQNHLRENPQDYAGALLDGESITVTLDGDSWELTPEEVDVLREPAKGYAVTEEGRYLAALATTLTPDLVQEGLAREVIRRVQTMRKDADFDIDDRIAATYEASADLAEAVETFKDTIQSETLADSFAEGDPFDDGVTESFEFDDQTLRLSVRRT